MDSYALIITFIKKLCPDILRLIFNCSHFASKGYLMALVSGKLCVIEQFSNSLAIQEDKRTIVDIFLHTDGKRFFISCNSN
jgi:hypothetical protein